MRFDIIVKLCVIFIYIFCRILKVIEVLKGIIREQYNSLFFTFTSLVMFKPTSSDTYFRGRLPLLNSFKKNFVLIHIYCYKFLLPLIFYLYTTNQIEHYCFIFLQLVYF